MKKRSRTRKGILRGKLIPAIVVVAVMTLGLWELDRLNVVNLPFLSDDKDSQGSNNDSSVEYGPPTDQEKKETEEFKENQTSGNNATPPPVGQKRSVTPILTSWGQNPSTSALEGSGYIAGMVENSGTCTLTATKGSTQVSQSIAATQNAQNVSCGLISIPPSKLSAGTWSLALSYTSATSAGTSSPQNLEVK